MNTGEVLIPSNAEYLGETTVRKDLGVDFSEPPGVAYLDNPLHVYRTPLPDGERFDVTCDQPGLDGEQLFLFLREIAPDKKFGSLRGVAGDWGIVEAAQDQRVDSIADRAKALIRLHERLGEAWAEFMQSRPAFLKAVENCIEPNFTRDFRKLEKPENTRSSLLDQAFIYDLPSSINDLVTLLEPSGIPQAGRMTLVVDALKAEVDARRRDGNASPNISPSTLQGRYRHWSEHTQFRFLYQLMAKLPEESAEGVWAHLQDRFYDSYTLPSGETVCYSRSFLEGDLAEAFETARTVRCNDFEAQAITVQHRDGPGDIVVPGTTKRVAEPIRMRPLLAWTRKGNSRRSFVFERAASADGRAFADSVLGVLAVAYLSPLIRNGWPEYMRIGRSNPQFLGPAQVPVYALMRKNQLLASDFIEAAESVS